jgi:hypothetical protein
MLAETVVEIYILQKPSTYHEPSGERGRYYYFHCSSHAICKRAKPSDGDVSPFTCLLAPGMAVF